MYGGKGTVEPNGLRLGVTIGTGLTTGFQPSMRVGRGLTDQNANDICGRPQGWAGVMKLTAKRVTLFLMLVSMWGKEL